MRYAIFDGSKSAHCCFEYTVVDTDSPEFINGEHYKDRKGRLYYETICECFCLEDAELVCAALNAQAALHG